MLKLLKRDGVLIGALAAVALISMASTVWFASSQAATHDIDRAKCEADAQAKGGSKEACKSVWERTISEPVALYTFLLTVFTAILSGTAITQIWFLISANRIAAKNADAAIRAAKIAEAGLTARYRAVPTPTFNFDASGWIEIGARNLGEHVAAISIAAADIVPTLGVDFTIPTVTPKEVHTSISDGEQCQIFAIANTSLVDGYFCRGYFRWQDGVGKWERRFCVQVRTKPKRGELEFTTVGGPTWNHVVEST